MTKPFAFTIALLAACAGSHKPAPESTTPPPAEADAGTPITSSDRVETPSERLGSTPEQMPVIVIDGTIRPGSRLVAVLDVAVGPQFTQEGQVVTASVLPAPREQGKQAFPAGTKLALSVSRVQPAMSGSLGTVTLVPRAIEFNGVSFPIDGRIVAVQPRERSTGRPVNNTTADMPGTIVDPRNLTPSDRERDILGKGTVISVGATPPDNQIDKGSQLGVELRGPVPLALWEGKGELDVGWIRELLALSEARDGSELLGKRIELDKVAVESVIGDVVFWVGPKKTQRVLVVMDQVLDNPEKKTVVVAGQTVSIAGIVEAMPPREVAPLLWSMVSEKEAADFTPHPIYIYATKVTIEKSATTKPVKRAKTAAK